MADEAQTSETLNNMKGSFVESLVRNNKKIREDRAIAIAETADMLYKRTVEDLEIKIKQKKRDRDNALDLSPTTTDSLVLASDFDAQKFVAKDLALGLEIRNLEIELEIAEKRYSQLFKGE